MPTARPLEDDAEARYTAPLRALRRGDAHRAGAKAANLGDLMHAGFLVPDGFVLTTDAFDRFLSANALDLDTTAGRVTEAPVPPEIEEAQLAAVVRLGEGPLAVRSSGVAEDLSGASYAGLYETVLNVHGFEALVAAVRRCWASAFSDRVAAYGEAQGGAARGGAAGRMAVLVQHMVPAEAAGVVFTANPITGDRSETIVSAVRGLGERLVSGEAIPDDWLVRGDQVVVRQAPELAIDASAVKAVADVARRVEAHFGAPQDIEWALAAGTVHVLQARPITALPDHPSAAPAGRD